MLHAKQQAKSVPSPWCPPCVTLFRNLLAADLVSDSFWALDARDCVLLNNMCVTEQIVISAAAMLL